MHPWHDISTRPPGSESGRLHCFIEIPKGSKVKYEVDHATGLLFVDRILHSSVVYPHNYGFVPRTLGEDGDALDALVLMQEAVVGHCFLCVRPIGVLRMVDNGEPDHKLLTVHAHDPGCASIRDLSDLPAHRLREIEAFFRDYKRNEGKEVEVLGFGAASVAEEEIRQAEARYQARFPDSFTK